MESENGGTGTLPMDARPTGELSTTPGDLIESLQQAVGRQVVIYHNEGIAIFPGRLTEVFQSDVVSRRWMLTVDNGRSPVTMDIFENVLRFELRDSA